MTSLIRSSSSIKTCSLKISRIIFLRSVFSIWGKVRMGPVTGIGKGAVTVQDAKRCKKGISCSNLASILIENLFSNKSVGKAMSSVNKI